MTTGFTKNERIISKKNTENIYNFGSRVHSKSCTLIWRSHTNYPKIKLLIIVPKKYIKRAVDRNYTKRIIRECYKNNKLKIYNLILNPLEIILIYKKSTLPNFNELNTELLTLFKSLNN